MAVRFQRHKLELALRTELRTVHSTLDSIAISLSTNSIRQQDPKLLLAEDLRVDLDTIDKEGKSLEEVAR